MLILQPCQLYASIANKLRWWSADKSMAIGIRGKQQVESNREHYRR
jgi:hypothetical protein